MNNKKAFTLAEVLLTIVIIGFVAAMVMPTVIQNVYEAELMSMWKRQHSIVKNAWNMAVFENGGSVAGGFATVNDLAASLRKNLNVVNDCTTDNTKTCWATGTKYLNRSDFPGTIPAFALADGSFWGYRSGFSKPCVSQSGTMQDICLNLVVDVNGAKGPNMMGKDIYGVHLRTKTASAFGSDGDNVSGAASDCKTTGSGWACATQNLFKTNSQN